MKHLQVKKLLLLLFITVLQCTAFAQEDPEDIGQSEEVEMASALSTFTAEPGKPVEEVNEEELDIQARPATTGSGTLDAPPDCPECTPDPGGDVEDVPFDRRLLVILLAGAAYVYIKASRLNRKAETQEQKHEKPLAGNKLNLVTN